eukprot:scaffold689689_cov39-Attheya_sp.AAC.1
MGERFNMTDVYFSSITRFAARTAVNAVAPIEPFKLFHKIDKGVQTAGPFTSSNEASSGRSSKPAGLSSIGYACFWPNGGGIHDAPTSGDSSTQKRTSDQFGKDSAVVQTLPSS